MNLGPTELLLLLAVVLVLFGSTKLPALARSMGSARREFDEGMGPRTETETDASPTPKR